MHIYTCMCVCMSVGVRIKVNPRVNPHSQYEPVEDSPAVISKI